MELYWIEFHGILHDSIVQVGQAGCMSGVGMNLGSCLIPGVRLLCWTMQDSCFSANIKSLAEPSMLELETDRQSLFGPFLQAPMQATGTNLELSDGSSFIHN